MRIGYLSPAFVGAHKWRNCYVTTAFSRVPNAKRGEKIRSGCLTHALLGAPTSGRDFCVTPAFSGLPSAHPGEKITFPCVSAAFSGAQ